MRYGKVKANAGQACRVSKLNGWIFLGSWQTRIFTSSTALGRVLEYSRHRKVERVCSGHTPGVDDLRNSERDQG